MSENERSFLDATLPHIDAIYRVARSVTPDRWSAEDLVQETYLRAFAHFGSHTGTSTRGWLVTICLNLARSEWRRRARRPSEVPVESPKTAPSPSEQVFEDVNARLTQDAVSEALQELPLEQRTAIVMMDLAGHSAAEVAEMLGCPRGTVLARVHRGRRRLVALLAARGIGSELL
jgi:RNA polymerase sigma-70 factor, ECF subfamily